MKNKELTRDEMCILRDVLDTILDERETRKVFNQIHGTTTRQLDKLANKLATLVKSPVVVVPPPRKAGEHLWHESDGVTKCVTCFCDEDDANVGGEKCSYKPATAAAFARHQESLMTRHCTYCGADVPNSKGECGKCGL